MSKLLMIHLSDLHIVDNNSFCDERKKAINEIIHKEIINNSIEEVILLFTGDMTWSGKKDQFDIVYRYVDSVIKNIKLALENTYVGFYCCPGNHDIDFDIFNDSSNEPISKYIMAKSEFYKFAQKQKLFIDNKEFNLGTFKVTNSKVKIDFFSINSTFGSKKEEPDKGDHFLSDETIRAMKEFRSDNRTILLTHHFEDYFDEKSSQILQNFIKDKCDFVFFGHTHIEENGSYNIDGKKIGISRGGALHDYDKGSIFSVTVLDTDSNDYRTRVYEWESSIRTYSFVKEIVNQYNIKTNVYLDFYIQNNSHGVDFPNAKLDDIFVFPDLIFEQNKDKKISSFDKFIDAINDNCKFIIVKGFEKSGKTILSRYIFHYYAKNNGSPLLLTRNDERKTYDQTIKEAYRNQYDVARMDVNRYLKNDIPDKVLIIDDSNAFKSLFIENLVNNSNNFNKIILLCNDKKYFSLFNKGINIVDPAELCTFEVQPFIVSKRNELFTKTLRLVNPDIDKSKIEKNLKQMDKIISEQISIVTTNPEFLLLFAKSFGNRTYQSAGSNIFNEVFESNIVISLSKYNEKIEKKIDVTIALSLLESLGYSCFKNSKNIFNEEDLIQIINLRNSKSELKRSIAFSDYHTAFLASRIISEKDENTYGFISNSYLAYFAARYIKKLTLQKKREDFIVELQYLSDNISIDLCGDILLFLCYQTGDMSIIEHLVNKADDYFKSKNALDLAENKLSFLFSSSLPKRAIPTNEDRKSLKTKQEQKEQKALTTREKNEFEKETTSVIDNVFDGFRFVELIGKILPDFIENIEEDELIQSCVNSLYEYGHRFLYQMLVPLDDYINQEKERIHQLEKLDDLLDQNLNDFETKATGVAYQLIRIVYNSIARFSSTESTIKALDSYNTNSILYAIENLYMHAYIDDERQYIDRFKDTKKLLDEKYSKRNFLYNLMEDTFVLYLIKFPFKYYGEMQGLIDTTFLQPEKGKTKSSKKLIDKLRKTK